MIWQVESCLTFEITLTISHEYVGEGTRKILMVDANEKSSIDPAKADAIHRAVLTGLLGNIGFRSDAFEYTGARNLKFNIFPGSGVFKRKPAWIVAAEIVETTKLYARTVAGIKPEWIERLAAHLVTRTYSEPHWQEETAHVVAYEKVTL